MNRNVASLKLEGVTLSASGGSVCDSCGETFENPLLAMVFSESVVEEYYACPNCLSKVASLREEPVAAETPEEAETVEFDEAVEVAEAETAVDVDEVDEVVEDEVAEPAAEVAVEGDVEGPAGCAHYLGYLKKRGKNTAMPEECLTCSKMIDCMY